MLKLSLLKLSLLKLSLLKHAKSARGAKSAKDARGAKSDWERAGGWLGESWQGQSAKNAKGQGRQE